MKLLRSFLAAAAAALCLTSLPAAADPLTADQKDEVRSLIRQFLMENPEVILEAVQAHQAKAEQQERERQQAALVEMKRILENDDTSPVMGNPDGDVTIVEFMDYRCSFCKKAFQTMQELVKEDGKIRYVIKEFPILGPDSVTASQAALAVWRSTPDKYAAFHAALMEARGGLTLDKVLAIAADVGANPKVVREGMNDPEIKAVIAKNRELATVLGINGTPAFIIDGSLIPGARGIEDLRDMVAAARKG